ncbi:integrase [Zhongshania antarctica]|uniref:Integrase n=1 Tax=Zhongshania antarctica TaxID=641702 RepID=A0A840R846_9GAMM|nr:integrase arm-type DNA-binding domain-containing protein [Zhongshania antarctica]MBB5188552.1 integrase [Zhongshania antarctica]
MPLTDAKIKTAKPLDKDYKLSDEKGLFLLVKKSGGKYWRMKYRYSGKEKLLSIGVYPEVSLAQARNERDNARSLLAQDTDPMNHRKAQKAAKLLANANSFEAVSLEWMDKRGAKSVSGDARIKRILEKDLFPSIGSQPISDITPPVLLNALRKIEARGAYETTKKAKQTAGQIFRFAVAAGLAERDPSADLKGALKQGKVKHYSALTEPKEVGRLMAAIHAYQATPAVSSAIKLAPLFFCRPGELRQLEWSEVNFEDRRIDIPAEKMKLAEPHIIPLADQALAILKEQYKVSNNSRYVFPNARALSRPLSDNGMRIALRTMGYTNEQMTPHGFRAMARTLLDEVLGFSVDWIEHQLAHAVRDTNGRAYNRTKHLEGRQQMMQSWADYLDTLRLEIDNVIPITAAKK